MYIVWETKSWPYYFDDGFTLTNSLFGGEELTKNDNPNMFSYSGCNILFDVLELFNNQMAVLVKTKCLELILCYLCMLIIRKRYPNSW